MTFTIAKPGSLNRTYCKECTGSIWEMAHAITIKYGGASIDKWHFHLICFSKFQEQISKINVKELGADLEVVVK